MEVAAGAAATSVEATLAEATLVAATGRAPAENPCGMVSTAMAPKSRTSNLG